MKTAAILPPMDDNGNDKLVFTTDEEGNFYVSQMYKMLTQAGEHTMSKEWSAIWKLRVPERVRSFAWILKHDKLLTNNCISTSGFGEDGCSLCGAVRETSLHALRDCKVVKGLWDNIVPGNIKRQFFEAYWHDWLLLNIHCTSYTEPDWCNV